MPANQLGYYTDLLDDEPLDSWLTAIARGMGTSLRSLIHSIGITPKPAAYHLNRDLTNQDLERISAWSGIDHHRLTQATFTRWAPFGLNPKPKTHGIQNGAWPRNSGARCCQSCFAEREGRWKFEWFLQWTYACPRHRQLLIRACPACGTPFKQHGLSTRTLATIPAPCDHGCSVNAPSPHHRLARRRARRDEETDSVARPSGALDIGHPLLTSQEVITGIWGGQAATVAGIQTRPDDWFNDLSLLTKTFLGIAKDNGVVDAIHRVAHPEDQKTLIELVDDIRFDPDQSNSNVLAQATSHPRLIGALAAVAVDYLLEPDQDRLNARTAAIFGRGAGRTRYISPRRTAKTSPLIAALGGRGSVDRAQRADIRTALHHYPRSEALLLPHEVAARPPQALLDRHSVGARDLASAAIATATLALHETRPITDGTDLIGYKHITADIAQEWNRLLRTERSNALLSDICELRHALHNSGSPIDYARRRHTFPQPTPITDRCLRPLAKELDVTFTNAFKAAAAFFVWEQLTGSDALLTPEGLTLHGVFRARYRRLRTTWLADTPAHVTLLVEKALLKRRINEPLNWEPVHSEGAWRSPAPIYTRTLPGWNSRELRRSSRHRTRGQLRHASVNQVIALAVHETTDYAKRVRRNLERLAQLHDLTDGDHVPFTLVEGTRWLATELDRHITEPTHHGMQRTHQLTTTGAELAQQASAVWGLEWSRDDVGGLRR